MYHIPVYHIASMINHSSTLNYTCHQVITDIAADKVVTKEHVKTMLRDRQKHEQQISEIRRRTEQMTKQSVDEYFRRSLDRRGMRY